MSGMSKNHLLGVLRQSLGYIESSRFHPARQEIQELIDTVEVAKEPICVGTAGSMPGSSGFTMAAFKAEDVPVDTPLYADASFVRGGSQGEPAASNVSVVIAHYDQQGNAINDNTGGDRHEVGVELVSDVVDAAVKTLLRINAEDGDANARSVRQALCELAESLDSAGILHVDQR